MSDYASIKYPRSPHFIFSPGATNDDKIAQDMTGLIGVPIVLTEKIDGSNCSLEKENVFARTHAHSPTHSSFDYLKGFHANIKHKIPEGLQLFGENCFAQHSINYSELSGYFLLFNVRDLNYSEPKWLSWEEVEMWSEEIGVPTVPVLFKGICQSEKELQKLIEKLMKEPSKCGGDREGVVCRVERSFEDKDFNRLLQKCVRANHIQTEEHWSHQVLIKNKLKLD